MVKLHEYTESEDQFVLFMEYANDAEYFDSKIVEVSVLVMNIIAVCKSLLLPTHQIRLCKWPPSLLFATRY